MDIFKKVDIELDVDIKTAQKIGFHLTSLCGFLENIIPTNDDGYYRVEFFVDFKNESIRHLAVYEPTTPNNARLN